MAKKLRKKEDGILTIALSAKQMGELFIISFRKGFTSTAFARRVIDEYLSHHRPSGADREWVMKRLAAMFGKK